MPTYEYECEKCHKGFELSQSMKDPSLTICPKELCQQGTEWGEGKVKRKIGVGAGFIFKGSGFYITDYRSENYKSKAKSESAAAAPAPAPASTPAKTESAPAAKPAAAPKSD